LVNLQGFDQTDLNNNKCSNANDLLQVTDDNLCRTAYQHTQSLVLSYSIDLSCELITSRQTSRQSLAGPAQDSPATGSLPTTE
jgi:hypothetical protein